MRAKSQTPQNKNLFLQELSELVNDRHPLVLLSHQIDWSVFEERWAGYFPSSVGRPALPSRLVAGLLYLQHTFNHSDESVVQTWLENPYWQYFCGETYFRHDLPCDSSSLTNWRKRLGEEGVEWMLSVTIQAAQSTQVIEAKSFEKVIVDTTIQEKAIAYPTDSRLLNRCREHLVKLAKEAGIKLRQNYNREAPALVAQISSYAHARQYKRMKKALKKLKTRTGRVYRDLQRQVEKMPEIMKGKAQQVLDKARRVLSQTQKSQRKLYAFHASEVECISKGKARCRYEFGVKVSLVTTHKEGLVVGARSQPGNPYDGHILRESLEQMEILTGHTPKSVFVDLGFRGHDVIDRKIQVYHKRLKRGMTPTLKADIKRRSAIEPMIGHMKNEGKLRKNWLKGALGDALNAVLCACGHNLRMILRKLRLFYALLFSFIYSLSKGLKIAF